MIGTTLRVRYEVVHLITEGPIFTVYGGRDRVLNRDVTIRVIKAPYSGEPEFISRLEEVTKKLAEVVHPGLQRITSVDSDSGQQFIVGDAARGADLLDRVKKLAPFSAPVSVGTAIGICEGLAALHGANLVHGDVGVHNVNVTPEGDVQLELPCVWEAYGSSQSAGLAMLSSMAPYLAPEVSAGGMPSKESDVYGVGVILFELLTGRLPYQAETPLATALKHANTPTPSPREANSAIPVVLDEIVRKALSKDPFDRYSHAGEMLSDLRMLQDAIRFGRTLTWPIGSPVSKPATPAQRISAIEDEKPKKQRPAAREVDEKDEGDVPVWIKLTMAFLAGFLALMVLAWIIFNVRKPTTVIVPELQRLSVAEATERLRGLGLNLRVAQRKASEDIPSEQIMETSPRADQKVYEGSDVVAVVSSGSKYVEVPDVRGLNQDKAKMMLGSVGLELDSLIDMERSSEVEEGMIIGSEPAWGKKVTRGSKVRVKVSSGNRRPERDDTTASDKYLYSLKIRTSGLDSPVLVRVDLSDDLGTRTVHEERHDPNDEFSVEAEGFGTEVTFTIFYDGELVKTLLRRPGGNDE